jgi:Family of unknown function (DUF5681)
MVERYKPKEYVGYKQPPKHTRFKKGQSGNPSGRPKREPPAAAAIVAEELQSMVTVTENGQQLEIDKFSLMVKQAMNQAAKGKFQSVTSLVKILGPLDQLNKTPTKKHPRKSPYDGIDFEKLTLDERMKMLRDMIANSKPLDED